MWVKLEASNQNTINSYLDIWKVKKKRTCNQSVLYSESFSRSYKLFRERYSQEKCNSSRSGRHNWTQAPAHLELHSENMYPIK